MAVSPGRMYPVQVYTRSMDLILAPIASRVSQLLILCESASDVSAAGTPPFDMKLKASSLQAVMVELAAVTEKTVAQFNDDELAVDLPQACERTALASRKMADTANMLCSGVKTLNGHQLTQITASSQDLMNGCIQLLVAWDGAEVRKIVDAANRLLDRLRLVEAAKSMRGLLICLKGFSEPLFIMLALLDKRLKELTAPDMRRDLTTNLDGLKQCIPKLTAAAQACIRSPQNDNARSFCSYYVTEIERTVGQIIVIVQKSVPSVASLTTQTVVVEEYPLTRAATVEKAQIQLRSRLRYEDDSDLEHNINAVLHNSMAVAHVSRDKLRNMITQLCSEIKVLYDELKQQRQMLALNPSSAELRAQCDRKADLLCNKLLLLEKTVSEAVVDQISDAFVGTSAPLEHLVTAAVASQSSSEDDEDDRDLSKKVTSFREHSKRLSQVAVHAADGISDLSMVQQIRDTAAQVEKLAPQVTSAALSAHGNPRDQQAQQHLTLVKDEWTAKVKQLTATIDDVTDSQELLTASEALIREDMTRCRDAFQRSDVHGVQTAVTAVERRCHRLLELAKNEQRNTKDPVQSYSLSTTIDKMENALSQVTASCAAVLSNIHDVTAQKNLASSLRQIVAVTKELKQVLARKLRKTVATSTPMPTSHPILLTRGTQVDVGTSVTSDIKQQPPYISPIHLSGKTPLTYSTPIEGSSALYSPSIVMQPSVERTPSYSEGYSKSYYTGDAETQTAMPRKQDQNLQTQVEHQVAFPVYPMMVDASSSTTNLFSQTTNSIALQTDTDLLTDASIIDDPHGPYAAYVLPGQRMVSAVLGGDAEIVEQHAGELRSRVDKLVEMGHQTVKASPEDSVLIREVRDAISEVKKLTKALLAQAEDLLSDSENLSKAEQLKEVGREWADSVLALAAAVERGSHPWGSPPSRLTAEAAKGGNQLEIEIEHISAQTDQLVETAMTTVQTMEANGMQYDPETVQIVKVTASVIAKLAPILIQTAKEASSSQSSMESLNMISQEWATNAKLLAHSVDAMTDSPTSTMDHLAITAGIGGAQNFADQVSDVQLVTAALQEVAQNATMGCSDPEVIKLVTVTAHKIEKLSAKLVDCANAVSTASNASEHNTAVEQFTVVKHNWQSNVQLLTAHVDDLINQMAAPLSKLYSIAVTINKTESHTTKQHLVHQFAQMSDGLQESVNMLEAVFNETVSGVHNNDTINTAGAAIKIIEKLTPHAIAAAKSLLDDQSSAVVEHFEQLKRQWAAKAQSLHTQLMSITTVDMTPVLAVFEDMINLALPNEVGVTTSPTSRVVLTDSKSSPTRPLSQDDTSRVVMRPPHATTERPITIAVPQQATPSYSSISAAAWNLHQEADKFVSEGNPIISTAKEMSDHMRQLAEYTRGRGHIETKEDMIATAKQVATNARIIVEYARKIAQQCSDTRMKYNLEQCVELIPTLATQLTIISSVKAATPNDISADVMLVKNAQNLMEAVIKTMREAEAACMKGLTPSDDPEESEAIALAVNWKKNLYHRRNMESVRAPLGNKGLRRMDKSASTSSLVDIIAKARTRSIGSPPKR